LRHFMFIFASALLLATLTPQALGQEATADSDSPVSQSGYEKLPQFGGPDGVSGELRRNDEARESIYEWTGIQRAFGPYFDWKRWLIDEYGVSFGLQYYVLGQVASSSQEDDTAMGGIFRFNGSWTLLNRNDKNPGRIEWRVESRTNIFGLQAPMDLSGAVGAAAMNTGFPYTRNFDMDLSVINWTQGFRDSTTGVAAGRLAFDVYLDAMPFQTISRGFMNRGFVLNPTIATTGIGALGAVAKGFVGNNFWVGGQMHDANAVNGQWDFDTVQEGEWLTALEVGYSPSFEDRKKRMIQFTYWHKDRRSVAGTPSGSGWAVSSAWQLSDTLFPFLRFGHSDGGGGAAAESAISGGIEIKRSFDEIWTLGAGWSKPSRLTHGPGLRDEWIIESSYKFQMARNFSITPDVQVLINPANYPSKSATLVGGVRFILVL